MRLAKYIGIFILTTTGLSGIGCGDDEEQQNAPMPPWYNDTDSATDTGVDTGTGVEEWDSTPLPGINLMPNEEGFMKTTENPLGIQGAWYTFGCDDAVIDPLEGSTFNNPGRMCFSGTAPQVIDKDENGSPDWDTIWGAGMGFDICGMSEEEVAANPAVDTDTEPGPPKFRMGECPYNPDLANQLIGVSVRFSGFVNAEELRVQFNEGDNVANSYYEVDPADVAAGTVLNIAFKDPLVATHYDTDMKPSATIPERVFAIQFQVPAKAEGPVDWRFCVDAISAMTAQ